MLNFKNIQNYTYDFYKTKNMDNKLTFYPYSDSLHQRIIVNNVNLERLQSTDSVPLTMLHRTSETLPMYAHSSLKLDSIFLKPSRFPGTKLRIIIHKELDSPWISAQFKRSFLGLPLGSLHVDQRLNVNNRAHITENDELNLVVRKKVKTENK